MNKINEIMMKEKLKNMVIAFLVGIIGVLVIGTGVSYGSIMWLKNSEDTEYLKDQKVGEISFEKAQLVYEDGITTLSVEMHNNGSSDYNLSYVSINVKDENDNVSTLIGYVGDTLKKGEGKIITASIDKDLSNSKDIEYVINK